MIDSSRSLPDPQRSRVVVGMIAYDAFTGDRRGVVVGERGSQYLVRTPSGKQVAILIYRTELRAT